MSLEAQPSLYSPHKGTACSIWHLELCSHLHYKTFCSSLALAHITRDLLGETTFDTGEKEHHSFFCFVQDLQSCHKALAITNKMMQCQH